jgi:hypothetical protein
VSAPAPDYRALHETYGRQLTELLEAVLAGELMPDRAVVERQVVRLIGALSQLQQLHRIDNHGRCSICWTSPRTRWPWRKPAICTVFAALGFYLSQPNPNTLTVHNGQNQTDGQRPS